MSKNVTIRKLRKLVRNPRQYWADSKLRKILIGQKVNQPEEIKISNVSSKNEISNNLIVAENKSAKDNKKVTRIKVLENPKKTNNTDKTLTISKPTILSKINNEKIVVELNECRKSSLSRDNMIHLIQDSDDELLKVLLKQSDDITQSKDKNFFAAQFIDQIDKSVNTSMIFVQLGQEVKDIFSHYKFILIKNPKSHFIEAAKISSFKSQIICIITDEACMDILDPKIIDELILTKEIAEKFDIRQFRNWEICDNSVDSIYKAVRARLRELSSKDYNCFIPVYNYSNEENLPIDFTIFEEYDCLVKLKSNIGDKNHTVNKNFNEVLQALDIQSLIVREELVLKYKKTLIDGIHNKDFSKFLYYSLLDGKKYYEIN